METSAVAKATSDSASDSGQASARSAVDIRHIACNACGADRFQPTSTVSGGWHIGRCGDCGLVYVDPAPFFDPSVGFSEMSRGFEYTDYMHQPITPRIRSYERDQLAANVRRLHELTDGRRGTDRPVRFLDIGCGSGASVRAAVDLGWEAIGIDIDPLLVRKGRQELQVDLRCMQILDADVPAGHFDFIKLRDVVEHLPNPRDVLARVAELLVEDGLALIVTPNEGGLATRLRLLLGRPRTLVATVPPPHHLHSFGPSTLAATLRKAGLEPHLIFTTTPSDRDYVTSHNVERVAAHSHLRPAWWIGRQLGMGAMLVGWAGRARPARD
jgi:2-polyprenyl-3-methyl-5-hydroxy-6-metoxy-1,4-benzoquinol methylase